jgi:hypothetical protein
MPALNSALRDISAQDVQRLVGDAWQEDEVLEFKVALSTSNGRPHAWLNGPCELGVSATRDLLSEVVAMANSYGGDVVLGIRESDDKPPRAVEVVPIANCVELAHRLEMAARDLIKPQVPLLSVRGVPIADGAGVVIIRAPKSRSAPHRLEMSGTVKECYRRVSDRSEQMSMREIQELTLSVSRGLDNVQGRLAASAQRFSGWFDGRGVDRLNFAFRLTGTPLSAEPYLNPIHGVLNARPITQNVQIVVGGRRYPCHTAGTLHNWRPVLRGTEAVDDFHATNARVVSLGCDGTLQDMTYFSTARDENRAAGGREFLLYPGWFFGMVACAFRSIDRYRRAAGAEAVQYAIEIEFKTNAPLPVIRMGDGMFIDRAGTIESPGLFLPQYQLGEPDDWNSTMNLIWRDFWNAIGVGTDDEVLEVPWQEVG